MSYSNTLVKIPIAKRYRWSDNVGGKSASERFTGPRFAGDDWSTSGRAEILNEEFMHSPSEFGVLSTMVTVC